MKVEVVFASIDKQKLVSLDVSPGLTIREIIECSGLIKAFPEIDLTKHKVGVFGQPKSLEFQVKAGDRIEIYRPLLIDPKEARRARVNQEKHTVNII